MPQMGKLRLKKAVAVCVSLAADRTGAFPQKSGPAGISVQAPTVLGHSEGALSAASSFRPGPWSRQGACEHLVEEGFPQPLRGQRCLPHPRSFWAAFPAAHLSQPMSDSLKP